MASANDMTGKQLSAAPSIVGQQTETAEEPATVKLNAVHDGHQLGRLTRFARDKVKWALSLMGFNGEDRAQVTNDPPQIHSMEEFQREFGERRA